MNWILEHWPHWIGAGAVGAIGHSTWRWYRTRSLEQRLTDSIEKRMLAVGTTIKQEIGEVVTKALREAVKDIRQHPEDRR